ncbi:MAG: hypothetical protein JSW62_01275 [Thermoplasmatales archaeon]|nr:MAG: hypothetical protein JSW62_01275 [Thermoplasmatales archaeon]
MNTVWDIKTEDFPKDSSIEEQIKFCLSYGILAPSTHNSQPWLFKISKSFCDIFNDPSVQIIEGDPNKNYLYLSIGCLIENIIIAADYFKLFKSIKYYTKKNDDLLARLYFQRQNKKKISYLNKDLVSAITNRFNARGLFQSKKISKDIIKNITKLNNFENIQISFIDKKTDIEKIAQLTAVGVDDIYKNNKFRSEMSKWINNNLSSKKRGMPGYTLKMPLPLSIIFPLVIPHINLGKILSKLNYASVSSAPSIIIFSSKSNDQRSMIEVGRISQRTMLYLASKKIKHSVFVASLEKSLTKSKLKKIADTNYEPRFLFCVGYIKTPQIHSPRLPLSSRLIK